MTCERFVYSQAKASSEFKERKMEQWATWLGGLFEVGGTMGLTKKKEERNLPIKEVYPWMAFNSRYEEEIDALKRIFDGSKFSNLKRSWRWQVSRRKALELVSLIEPYARFRTEYFTAFRNWEDADLEERIEIAETLSEFTRNCIYPSSQEYEELVTKPDFVAGVFDAGGRIQAHETLNDVGEWGWTSLMPIVNSKNRPLLEALQKRFGGGVYSHSIKDTEFEIGGKKSIVTRASYRWLLSQQNLVQAFAQEIYPSLLFKKSEVEILWFNEMVKG